MESIRIDELQVSDMLTSCMTCVLFCFPELTDGIFIQGGVIDFRNVKFDISEAYETFRFSDVNFFLRMNHSRLITSRLKWRPQLFSELKASRQKNISYIISLPIFHSTLHLANLFFLKRTCIFRILIYDLCRL